MPKLPRNGSRQVIAALEKMGFTVARRFSRFCVLGIILLLAGCSVFPSAKTRHYQGTWMVGGSRGGFTTLDGQHTYSIEMPRKFDKFFTQEGGPPHRGSGGSPCAEVEVDVSGYLYGSKGDPDHPTLHVLHVYKVSRAKKQIKAPDTYKRHADPKERAGNSRGLSYQANSDTDGDGVPDREEVLAGTDPGDAFNGGLPIIETTGNSRQGDFPGLFLAHPFAVRIRNAAGALIHHASVAYTITSGSGHLALKRDDTSCQANRLIVSTDHGEARAFFKVGTEVGSTSVIIATIGSPGRTANIKFTATVGDAGAAPVAPSEGVCTRQSPTSVLVEWLDNSDNETAFYVTRSRDNQTWEQIATLRANTTSYIDASAPVADGPFMYGVIAHNEAPE